MQLKKSTKKNLFIMGIIGIMFSMIGMFVNDFNFPLLNSNIHPLSYPNTQTLIPSSEILPFVSISKQEDVSLPVRIMIPKIYVDTIIEHVGITTEGDMDIPKIFTNTAWFNLGPLPGEVGTAVIAGHFGFINKQPGAFNNLSELTKGDKIMVQDANGAIITFVVREYKIYDQDEIVSDIFESNDGGTHLNLITCQGTWNKTKKSYSKRLVLFTDKE